MVAASQTIPWFAQILTTSLTTNLPQVTAGGNLELFALRPLGSAASLRLLVQCLGGNNSRGIGLPYDWFSREELGKQKIAPSQSFDLDVLSEAQGFPGRLLEVSTSMKLRQRPEPHKRVEARQEIMRELEAKYPRPRQPVDAASGVAVPQPQPVVPAPLVVPSVVAAAPMAAAPGVATYLDQLRQHLTHPRGQELWLQMTQQRSWEVPWPTMQVDYHFLRCFIALLLLPSCSPSLSPHYFVFGCTLLLHLLLSYLAHDSRALDLLAGLFDARVSTRHPVHPFSQPRRPDILGHSTQPATLVCSCHASAVCSVLAVV